MVFLSLGICFPDCIKLQVRKDPVGAYPDPAGKGAVYDLIDLSGLFDYSCEHRYPSSHFLLYSSSISSPKRVISGAENI